MFGDNVFDQFDNSPLPGLALEFAQGQCTIWWVVLVAAGILRDHFDKLGSHIYAFDLPASAYPDFGFWPEEAMFFEVEDIGVLPEGEKGRWWRYDHSFWAHDGDFYTARYTPEPIQVTLTGLKPGGYFLALTTAGPKTAACVRDDIAGEKQFQVYPAPISSR